VNWTKFRMVLGILTKKNNCFSLGALENWKSTKPICLHECSVGPEFFPYPSPHSCRAENLDTSHPVWNLIEFLLPSGMESNPPTSVRMEVRRKWVSLSTACYSWGQAEPASQLSFSIGQSKGARNQWLGTLPWQLPHFQPQGTQFNPAWAWEAK
jgi:hypothetical protein